jgi:hypothetical protein
VLSINLLVQIAARCQRGAQQLFASHVIRLEVFAKREIKDFEVNPSTWEITGLMIALSQ